MEQTCIVADVEAKVFHCPALSAWLTPGACRANQQRISETQAQMKKKRVRTGNDNSSTSAAASTTVLLGGVVRSVYAEMAKLECCIGCPGVTVLSRQKGANAPRFVTVLSTPPRLRSKPRKKVNPISLKLRSVGF